MLEFIKKFKYYMLIYVFFFPNETQNTAHEQMTNNGRVPLLKRKKTAPTSLTRNYEASDESSCAEK